MTRYITMLASFCCLQEAQAGSLTSLVFNDQIVSTGPPTSNNVPLPWYGVKNPDFHATPVRVQLFWDMTPVVASAEFTNTTAKPITFSWNPVMAFEISSTFGFKYDSLIPLSLALPITLAPGKSMYEYTAVSLVPPDGQSPNKNFPRFVGESLTIGSTMDFDLPAGVSMLGAYTFSPVVTVVYTAQGIEDPLPSVPEPSGLVLGLFGLLGAAFSVAWCRRGPLKGGA
jgi:hypothetical protein